MGHVIGTNLSLIFPYFSFFPQEHIQEVLDKWTQIDDEIWAKVIVLERNRRVAKAYARAPVLTVNGSDDGFDGFRIGLCGFDNPMRDPKTEELKKHIGLGIKVKMDDQGNILVKRVSKCNVYVKTTSTGEETSIGADVLKLPNCALESEKPVKLFDMKKFQQNVSRELQRAYPDRRRLECQCLSAVAFVKSEPDLLDCPIWILIINVVAMDMLKSKLPPEPAVDFSILVEYRLIPSLVRLHRRSDKPPKLPPRDMNNPYPHDIPKPDYDDTEEEEENRLKPFPVTRGSRGGDKKNKDNKKYDDPYYCGLRARVPNFVKAKRESKAGPPPVMSRYAPMGASNGHLAPHPHSQKMQQHQVMWHARSYDSGMAKRESKAGPPPVMSRYAPMGASNGHLAPHPHSQKMQQHQVMWHARSYDSGMDTEYLDSPYHQIYGRLPIPTRGYIPTSPRAMYISHWD
ncbi:uncharacterized protein LOC103505685 [Diaphorina citri]|uniref:Uncharacterized protein LOC103505685 n=1 Tax=Diaphorina citri TaxID=121845 RepID=A0A3Q0IKQ9_DIACI|nr:uncharacterized protein LOC103505685 [Diaphorina citri]